MLKTKSRRKPQVVPVESDSEQVRLTRYIRENTPEATLKAIADVRGNIYPRGLDQITVDVGMRGDGDTENVAGFNLVGGEGFAEDFCEALTAFILKYQADRLKADSESISDFVADVMEHRHEAVKAVPRG